MEQKAWNAKRVGMVLLALVMAASALLFATGCSSQSNQKESSDPITMVWLPDNSSADLTQSREAIGDVIKEATGRDVELMTTTDYNVAIEAISSGSAQMALLGAEGYVQANSKNDAVQAAFTNSDENGALDGACYCSRICVPADQAANYKDGDGYSLDKLKGKKFSFVSATSTSGFKVPSSAIMKKCGVESSDDLLQDGTFFSKVMFGDSHQGSAVNLLSGQSDAAAFDDVDVDMYLDLVSGSANAPGAVYKVKDDAVAPFDSVRGKEFTIIGIAPVLNAPFCYNTDKLSDDEQKKITEAFCSAETASNKEIFADPDDENAKAIFDKDSDKTCFVACDDAWYNPIREFGA